VKRENQIGCRVSFPSSFFMELEDCWKHEAGAHRALTFQGFLNMMVGFGLETYKAKNLTPAPEEAEPEEGPCPADDEAWEEHTTKERVTELESLFKEWDEVMGPPPPGMFNFTSKARNITTTEAPDHADARDFPRNNRRPLLRFGGEQ
jgi:hypothetical protein